MVGEGRHGVLPEVAVLGVEATAVVNVECRTFSLELEHRHARVVPRGEKILVRMGSQDPEAVRVATECLNTETFRDIPHANCAVFRVGDDELVFWVEENAGDVVGMPTHRVHLPCLEYKKEVR